MRQKLLWLGDELIIKQIFLSAGKNKQLKMH